ncbi:MAG: HAMP domain-containing protein, partial [Candidatus Hydrogenedentes bacterium]|nr:HAMP domain-containing protein [Candidatus Hydrogenedentota bacterium]
MPRRRLVWQIFPSHLFVTLAAVAAITAYMAGRVNDLHLHHVAAELEVRARLMVDPVRAAVARGDRVRVQEVCATLATAGAARITVISPNGEVWADSEESPTAMDNHGTRPEVMDALAGRVGSSVRFSRTRQRNMMYVALPVAEGGAVVAVLRAALPLERIQEALWSNRTHLILGAVVVALLAAAASWLVSRRITRPLEEMKQGAARFAAGDFVHHLGVPESEEMGSLAQAMNQMARELDDRIRTIGQERNEQEAVLSSMVEGVIAVDAERRILSLNRSAAALLGLDSAKIQGESMEAVLRNLSLQEFIGRALESDVPIEGEFAFHSGEDQIVRAHGTVLRDAAGAKLGAVTVLNDVTQLRRLEQVRRDFVANVSHELRTPITSIKGFVETLQDGAVANPEDARRFLEIVGKQADRLNA